MMAARVRQHRNALQMRADKPNWREETKRQNAALCHPADGDGGAQKGLSK